MGDLTVCPTAAGAAAAAADAVSATACTAGAATAATGAHDNLNGTLWMQSAAEYQAAALGSYAQARHALDAALADTAINALPVSEQSQGFESLPPAIITDADETLIDNSPFQARRFRDDGDFDPATWAAWSKELKARAIPGAVAFAQYAASRGVNVYYVTNRDHASEYQATADNLPAGLAEIQYMMRVPTIAIAEQVTAVSGAGWPGWIMCSPSSRSDSKRDWMIALPPGQIAHCVHRSPPLISTICNRRCALPLLFG